MNIDFEHASFPTIRRITFTCHADHFPADTYKRSVSAMREPVAVSPVDSLAMRESNEKTDEATKIARHSIGRRNACLLEALCHLNKNQRAVFFEPRTKNSFVVFVNAFLIHSKATFRSNDVKKIDLANTKRLCIAAKRGNWKDKRKLLVQRGGFLPYIIGPILSILLSRIIDGSNS